MQAQHHQIDLRHQRALGASVLAQFGGDADQLDAGHGLQPFANLQAGGAGFAIYEYFVHVTSPRISNWVA